MLYDDDNVDYNCDNYDAMNNGNDNIHDTIIIS